MDLGDLADQLIAAAADAGTDATWMSSMRLLRKLDRTVETITSALEAIDVARVQIPLELAQRVWDYRETLPPQEQQKFRWPV